MAKWRRNPLESSSLQAVDDALAKGEILRTHILRPTWHFIAAEDIRWMLQLSGGRIRTAFDSYAKSRKMEITGSFYAKGCRLLEQLLGGNKSLTKQELMDEFGRAGVEADNHLIHYFLVRAETDGLVCSGVDKQESRPMLCWKNVCLGERTQREEAAARLVTLYFPKPFSGYIADFVWWSGLTTTEQRQAVASSEPICLPKSLIRKPFLCMSPVT